ncbi:hypothetical protein K3495_g11607 [Podosphaera aphanis]|nr:hypothetical protein K3495_g11607 [Podosphaera aphanis]
MEFELDSRNSFEALSTQKSLGYLRISGNIKHHDPDNGALKYINSISCLTNLKYLEITTWKKEGNRPSDYEEHHVIAMLQNLTKLENVSISC